MSDLGLPPVLGEFIIKDINVTVLTRPVVWIADIKQEVARFYGLSAEELISASTVREIVRPRQVAMWICSKLTKRSLSEIGRRFGGKDHATVLWALRSVEKLIDEEAEEFRDLLRLLGMFPNVLFENGYVADIPFTNSWLEEQCQQLARNLRQAIEARGVEYVLAEIILDPVRTRLRYLK